MKRTLFLLLCLLLASCNMPGQPAASTSQAWFDMPLPDTVFYPPNPCKLIAHGASPSGIAAFEISINGAVASNASPSDSKATLATLNTNCPTLAPGKNILEVRARDHAGQWSDSAQTTVFLVQSDSVTATPPPLRTTDTPVSTRSAVPTLTATLPPTSTITPIPTLTATATQTSTFTPLPPPASDVSVERVSANLVYLGDSTCGANEVTILARAVASNGIKVVVLFYRFVTANSSSGFQGLSMNPIGGDLYEIRLNPNSLLGGAIPFDQATLQYQVVIQQNDGDTSIRTPIMADIVVQACGRVVTASCSSYTDERTCIANGCNWVNIPGTVPIFECRNP